MVTLQWIGKSTYSFLNCQVCLMWEKKREIMKKKNSVQVPACRTNVRINEIEDADRKKKSSWTEPKIVSHYPGVTVGRKFYR